MYRYIIFVVFVFNGFTTANGWDRIKGTNQHYNYGDWTTYATTRFVRQVSLGERFVYFATTGGILRYNFFSNEWDSPWTQSNGLADQNIFLVAKDFNTGYLWCVTGSSLSYLEPASQLWYNYYFDELTIDHNSKITSIGFGDDQKVYLVTNRGEWLASGNTFPAFFSTQATGSRTDIKWSGEKALNPAELPYLNMSDGYMLDMDKRYIDDFQLRHFPITSWVQDNWNNIWVGTWGLGVARGNINTMRLDLLEYGLWQDQVTAIAKVDDNFWLGGIRHSDSSAVTRWDIPDGIPNYFERMQITGFGNADVTAIMPDGDIIWFGTENGLVRYHCRRDNWRTFSAADNLVDDYIYDVAADDKYIWVATAAGVSVVVKSTVGTDSLKIKHIEYRDLRNIAVFDLDIQDFLVWMATEWGIYVYNTQKKQGGFYKTAGGGPVDPSTFAVSCYDQEVWFGTDEGIFAYNRETDTWLPQPAKFYKTDAEIYRILAAEKAVWVATNQGAFKFDRNSNRWVQYTVDDGLPSDNVYSLYLDGDYVWFGTSHGLTRFLWSTPYRID
ncbi:hypothetical protein JW935_22640 [candidate division KSB1 bacterium]|nr:hypothetical protein [candidate division KSB1 bacterium]